MDDILQFFYDILQFFFTITPQDRISINFFPLHIWEILEYFVDISSFSKNYLLGCYVS